MEAKIVFTNSTYSIPETIWSKSLLLTNLAEDKLLTDPIIYPYQIDQIAITCLMEYLLKNNIDPNWKNCDWYQIRQFVEFFQLTQSRDIYHNYYNLINDGSLSALQKILRCQSETHDYFLRPVPPELDVTSIRMKIDEEFHVWNTEVEFNKMPPIITLSPLNQIIRVPQSSYQKDFEWQSNVDIFKGQIDLNQNFWLHDLPWSGVGVAGGFVVSSLVGALTDEQDIDLWVLNFDVFSNLIQHFAQKVPDLQIYAPITYQNGFSILTLKSVGQRPLQIICSGYKDMSSVVRTFDLSHLRIWLDENGLHAEVTTFKELLLGYGRVIRRGDKTPARIKKYSQRGWFILGDNNFIKTAPNRPDLELTLIDVNTCLAHCHESKVTLCGYINQNGLHLGHIKDITLTDIQQLRVVDLGDYENGRIFTPIYLVIPINHLVIFSNKRPKTPAKAIATITPALEKHIHQIYDHLHNLLDVVHNYGRYTSILNNNILPLTLDDSLLEVFSKIATNFDQPMTIEIEFYAISKKVDVLPRLTHIFK